MNKLFRGALRVLCATVLSTSALAHTPYLVPNTFEPLSGNFVTLDASFAEHFFVPEVAFDNEGFSVTHPDGSQGVPETRIEMKTRTVLEHSLVDEGTYRFSTGRRMGRINRFYMLDGEREIAKDPQAELPEGAKELAFFQSVTLAETYVTRGATSQQALAPRGEGIEYELLVHPNALFVDEAVSLRILFDGEPLSKQSVDVFLAKGLQGSNEAVATIASDERGRVDFTPEEGGVYLLRSRYRAPAPDGAQAPEYSHTYTLVIEVIE